MDIKQYKLQGSHYLHIQNLIKSIHASHLSFASMKNKEPMRTSWALKLLQLKEHEKGKKQQN